MNITVEKRFLSLLLAFFMVLALVPVGTVHIHANGNVEVTTDTGRKLTINSNGDSAYTEETNNGDGSYTFSITGDGGNCKATRTTTLTITNNESTAITFDFSWSWVQYQGTFTATSSPQRITLDANGGSITFDLTSQKNGNKTQIKLYDFKEIITTKKYDVTIKPDANGTITVDGTAISTDTVVNTDFDTGVTVSASPKSGYVFIGWYDASGNHVSDDSTYKHKPDSAITIVPKFAFSTAAIFGVRGSAIKYDDLTEACNVALTASDKTVVLLNSGTISGTYEIPSGVTLLIPFNSAYSIYTDKPYQLDTYTKPSPYQTLTMANGSSITVYGNLNVGGAQSGYFGNNGCVTGQVGFIKMEANSSISMESGSNLYAWGYITGSGTVHAKLGSTVYESFQVMDFRGGDDTSAMATNGTNKSEYHVFPMSQYYMQNIEVPLTIHAGAKEFAYMSANITMVGLVGSSVPVISGSGGGAMFQLIDGCITKDYDEGTDKMKFTISGDVTISSLELSMQLGLFGNTTIDSSNFNLPIPGHMSVDAISGKISLDQNIALLPGSELIVREGVSCTVTEGTRIVVYDLDQWGNYTTSSNVPFKELAYAPGRGTNVAADRNKDAMVQVDGTIDASAGAVYTTSSGANIFTTGTGNVVTTPGAETVTYQVRQNVNGGKTEEYDKITITPAKLKHGGAAGTTYLETSGAAANTTYLYCTTHERWYTGECGCCADNNHLDAPNDKDHNCDYCGKENITQHEYTAVVTAPTCTEKGYTTYTCNCGDTKKDDEVASLGHTEAIDEAVEPTCTETGLTEGKKCSVCNEVLVAQEEVPAIAHRNKVHHAKVDATCVSTGKIEYWFCPDCGKNFSDEACTAEAEELVIPVDNTNHVNTTSREGKPATCLEDGYTAGVFCEDCKTWVSGNETITAKGSHTEEILPAKDPTCTETGLTEGKKCSVCNEVLVAKQTIPAKGHTEVIDAAKAPTCTETGLTEGKHCSVCDAVIVAQTEVKALGHTFGNITVAKVATCIAAGNEAYKQCSRCNLYFAGDAEINATDGKADTSAFVIGIDSNNHSNKKPHAETPATCLEVGYTAGTHCDDCNQWISGHDVIPAIAHKNKVYHEKVDATCVATGTIEYWSCPDCGKNFSDESCTTEAVDLVIPKDPTKHVNTIVHVEKPATCLEAGYTAGTYCNDCETWISGHEVISATDHNMQQTAAAVAPTCTEPGKTAIQTCANGCGKTEGGEEIPSTGHSGGEATCLEPKECTVCGASYGDKNPSNHVSSEFTYVNNGATHAKYYACCEALAQESEAHNHVKGKCVCGNTLSYTVYWNVNGAVAETDEGLSYGMTPAFDGKTPAKEHDANCHYTFAGWAASADGEVMATLPAVTKTVTYYAVFTAEAHTDAPADQNHACDVCGRAEVSVHTYSDATCTAPATCTDCGATTGEVLAHIDASPKDHKCDRECGEVNMGTHEAASGKHTCDYCSQPVTHCKDSLSLTSEISADCTTAGNHAYYTCSVCGMYYSDADATQAIAKDSWITPATGHAFEELGTVCTNGCEYTRAAKIGETSYETLDAALAAAQPGDTIVALTKIVIEGDVTWDLTGKKLDVQYLDAENYALVVKGNLTIKGGEFNFANMYGIGVRQTGTLVIDGGKFTTSEDEYLIGSWGTTTINGGTFESVYCNVNGFNGTLTVNGGNFTVTGNDAEYPSSDIFAAEDVATIYGGTYSTDISEYLAPEYKVSLHAGKYVVSKCDHATVTEVIDPAPTCTDGGLATCTCVDCQHMYTKALPATGHTDTDKDNVCDTCTKPLCTEDNHKYETIPGKAATCTATGLTEYQKCTACGHIPVQPTELPIVAHQGTWSEPIPATCENPGRLGYFQCTMCGGIFDSNQKALTSLVIPASGHDYVGEITQDPTCTEPGVKTFTCKNDASHFYTEPVSAKGHTYGTWITEVPATCTDSGVKGHYHCGACGANFDADKNPLVDLVIPAKGHAYDAGVITTPPTCTEPGIKTFTCQNDASHTYTEAVEAKGHAYGEWIAEVPAKCTEDGTKGHYHCDVCGKNFDADKNLLDSLVIDAPGHTEVTDKAVDPTCTEKGKTEGTRCDVCKAVLVPQSEVPALGHKDENKDHVCDNGCDVYQGTHADSAEDDDHVCDYGCQAVLEDCSDVTTDKDHDCDVCGKKNVTDHDYKVVVTDPTCETDGYTTYTCNCTHTYTGDVVSALGHKDVNKDHVCDNGCGVYQGKHEDTDKNHNCDHGCAETIGTCADSDHDHDCDYGCDQYYGVHEDKNQDHKCDYGCTVTIGTCEDTDKDHYCDYGCGKYYGTHADSNGADDPDHNCDYCDQKIEDCYDNDTNHICDECGTELSECSDSDDPDHNCDYCGKKIEDCYDTDPKDHKCDECGATLSQCADSDDNDHNCDYCGEENIEGHTPGAAATCTTPQICTECKAVLQAALGHRDDDKNHACDNGCDVKQGDHKDDNKDHRCDYGCAESIGTCEDTDHDHYCDYGCTKYYGTHEDTDKDHKCDYGCTVTIGTCEDTDKDHACDYGCDAAIGTHGDSATDNDHLCDYGCGEVMEACSDMTGDGDHICDYCGSSEVLTQCTGGTPVRENENPATVAEAGSYDSVVYCSECGEELSRDTIVIPQLLSQVETEEFTDSTIPETIKTNPNYNTVEKLADAMSDAVIAEVITESIRDNDLVSVKDVQTQLMDVTLQYSTDGETWQKADEEHFPDDGKIEIILPVPEGTKHSRYTYYVAHMFTSGAFGNTAGEMEYPEVDEIVVDGQECIRFYVTGLSPITVSYLETEPCADGHTHDSYGYDETNHWSICSICGETFAATPHTFENDACGCGAKRVKVVAMGQIQYTVSGQTVTVTHDTACRVGYLVNGKYKALPAIKVSENCYRFIAPADVEEVLLVAVADLDQDGDVDADDMDILSNGLKPKAHASYKPLDAWQQFAADVNNNGKLNAADLLLVARSQTGHEMYKALTW